MLRFDHVTKQYGHVMALDDFSMQIPDGSIYGFVGPNGAGKTTAIRLMCGLDFPDEGVVSIDDMEAGSGVRRMRRRFGYVPDFAGNYPNLRVLEYMDFFASCYELSGPKVKRRIQMLLDLVGLADRQNQFMDSLSFGMQQKLSLARALIHDPKLLILDEPTAGLDPATREDFRRIMLELAEAGKTIVMSSHILTDIMELCTDVGIIDHGHMVMEGRLQDVLKEVNASNPIIISVAGAVSRAMETLKSDQKVRSITIRNREILITYSGSSDEESALLKKLITAGVPVRSFHREKGNLESLFLQLTGVREERRVTYYEAESDL